MITLWILCMHRLCKIRRRLQFLEKFHWTTQRLLQLNCFSCIGLGGIEFWILTRCKPVPRRRQRPKIAGQKSCTWSWRKWKLLRSENWSTVLVQNICTWPWQVEHTVLHKTTGSQLPGASTVSIFVDCILLVMIFYLCCEPSPLSAAESHKFSWKRSALLLFQTSPRLTGCIYNFSAKSDRVARDKSQHV